MKILIPTDINDITLEQYQRFALVNVEGAEQEFLMHKCIEIFCDVDIKLVSKFPLKDAEEIYLQLMAILNDNVKFQTRFEFNGVEYGFIPELAKMSLGEFIDLEEGLKDPKEYHKALCAMYRPIVKDYKGLYTIEPYEPNPLKHDEAKQMPLGIVTSAVVFFYNIANELLQASPDYIKKLMKTTDSVEKINLQKSTGGSIAFMHYAKVIQQNLDLLLK